CRDSRELIDVCQKICSYLQNTDNDWNRRVDRLKEMRGLLIGGMHRRDDFINNCLPLFEDPLVESVKDLRSSVCREACVTTAYYAEMFNEKFSKICESLLPITMNLMQNSAKVMASSGINANMYFAKYVRHPKILAIIVTYVTHKSKELRRNTQNLLKIIIENWGEILERHMPTLVQAVRAGIYDADVETRNRAREAFNVLQSNFPSEADRLFQTIEPNKQRMLSGITSTASSTHSINNDRGDHLPSANRGIYAFNAQNAYLANRSTSELNPLTVRRMQQPNMKSRGIQPLIRPSAQMRTPIKAMTPAPSYSNTRSPGIKATSITPHMSRQLSNNVPSSSKSASQPGSRSGSPTRMRLPKQISTNRAINGSSGNQALNFNQHAEEDLNKVVKKLKNVTMERNRFMQPNIVRTEQAKNVNTPLKDYRNINQMEYNADKMNSRMPKTPIGSTRTPLYSNGHNANSLSSGVVTTTSGSSISTDQESLQLLVDNKQALSRNIEDQKKVLQKICESFNLEEKESIDNVEIDATLALLSSICHDHVISLSVWEQFFDSIFYLLLKMIDKRATVELKTKLNAFRALKDMAAMRPERLLERKELTIISIINANEKDNTQISRAAEETGAFIASRLPSHTCFEIFLSLVDPSAKSAEELTIATKILTRVIESIPPNEVAKYVPRIVPAMAKCYEHTESIVRRSAIICLVAVSSAAGMESLKPHLNASTMKLVEVYRQKITKSSAK
uniref:TOG domain-containing protein n=1 Tax=Acrobeloides nanus TaxID=290746 RepID=A0A914BXA3_9BILA